MHARHLCDGWWDPPHNKLLLLADRVFKGVWCQARTSRWTSWGVARHQLTLVDLSSGMLAVSRELNPECEHHVGDMCAVRLGPSGRGTRMRVTRHTSWTWLMSFGSMTGPFKFATTGT